MTARYSDAESGLGEALCRSAAIRTWGVLGVACVMLVVVCVRFVATGEMYNIGPLLVTLFLIGFELSLLRFLNGPRREALLKPMPAAVHTMVECSLPTVVMVFAWVGGEVQPPVLLMTPAVTSYALFIVLSILWLRPWLAGLAGGVCALQHAGLMIAAAAQGKLTVDGMPPSLLVTYPILLAMIGGAAWFATSRMRAYVESAVLEAERRATAEGELEAASVVQQGLLPQSPPELSGWSVAGWNRPAEQTGGDYWDWTGLPDGKVAVSIADVTGHGLGPAVVTAFCRAYARSSIGDGAGLAAAVRRVAKLLADDMPSGRFVTYAVALLTPDAGRVALLSAGHGPSLLVRGADGDVKQFGANELPLGVVADMAFDEVPELDLAPGDTLVLLTDGFFEWQNPTGRQWGLERLADSVAAHRGLNPSQMIAAILADVERFADGAPQADDLTAVVIRRASSSSAM